MAGQELTRDEVFALAGAFPVGSARTLLSLARFPSWAVPETGYANAREFWAKVSEQLGAGVMPGGRVQILESARDWFPANERLAALAAAAGPAPAPLARTALRVLVIGASPLDPDLPHVRFYRDERGVRLRGVVLAACDGQTLAPFFAGVADTVIAHRDRLADQCSVAFAEQFYTLLNAEAGRTAAAHAAPGHAVTRAAAPDLAGVAREAAQLTAQYSAACDPVIASLIVLHDGG